MNNDRNNLLSFLSSAAELAKEPSTHVMASRTYFEAAKILWSANRRDEAQLYLRKALILDPNNHSAALLLKHPLDDPSEPWLSRRRHPPDAPSGPLSRRRPKPKGPPDLKGK